MADATPLVRALAQGGNEETRSRKADGNFFPTPPDVTEALLRAEGFLRGSGVREIWEPHAGEGHLAGALLAEGHKVHATDLVDRGFTPGGRDFLDATTAEFPHVEAIVMNPPFEGIAAHIRHALSFGLPYVASLVQAEFWARKKHLSLFREHPPSRLYACAWKPDFTGGGSGIFCVQWCVWDDRHDGPTTFRPLERPACASTLEMAI